MYKRQKKTIFLELFITKRHYFTSSQNTYLICLIYRSDQKSAPNAWGDVLLVILTGQAVNIPFPAAVNITCPLTRPVNSDYLSTSLDTRWTNHDRVFQTVI